MNRLRLLLAALAAVFLAIGLCRAQDVITPENIDKTGQEAGEEQNTEAAKEETPAQEEQPAEVPPDPETELADRIDEAARKQIETAGPRDDVRKAAVEKLNAVVALCDQYVEKFPKGKRLHDVLYQQAEAYEYLYRYGGNKEHLSRALQIAGRIIVEKPDSAAAGRAHALRLTELRIQGKYQEALDEANVIVRNWPEDKELAPAAQYLMWDLYRRLKQPDKARETLVELAKKYPDTDEGRKAAGLLAREQLIGSTPDLAFAAPDGTGFKLADFRGKVVVVLYWASAGDTSATAHEQLKQLHQLYGEQGLVVIGVSLDRSREAFEGASAKFGAPWKQAFDGQGWYSPPAVKVGVTGVPSNIVVDRSGKVRYADQWGSDLRRAIVVLLQEKQP